MFGLILSKYRSLWVTLNKRHLGYLITLNILITYNKTKIPAQMKKIYIYVYMYICLNLFKYNVYEYMSKIFPYLKHTIRKSFITQTKGNWRRHQTKQITHDPY